MKLQDNQDVCCCPLLTLAQEAAELRVSSVTVVPHVEVSQRLYACGHL